MLMRKRICKRRMRIALWDGPEGPGGSAIFLHSNHAINHHRVQTKKQNSKKKKKKAFFFAIPLKFLFPPQIPVRTLRGVLCS